MPTSTDIGLPDKLLAAPFDGFEEVSEADQPKEIDILLIADATKQPFTSRFKIPRYLCAYEKAAGAIDQSGTGGDCLRSAAAGLILWRALLHDSDAGLPTQSSRWPTLYLRPPRTATRRNLMLGTVRKLPGLS